MGDIIVRVIVIAILVWGAASLLAVLAPFKPFKNRSYAAVSFGLTAVFFVFLVFAFGGSLHEDFSTINSTLPEVDAK